MGIGELRVLVIMEIVVRIGYLIMLLVDPLVYDMKRSHYRVRN